MKNYLMTRNADNDFDTLDALKADIRTRREEEKKNAADNAFADALVDQAVDNMTVEIPQSMIEERMDDMMKEYAQYMAQQGIGLEQYLKMIGSDVASFRETTRATAEKQTRTEILLSAVADAENIEITVNPAPTAGTRLFIRMASKTSFAITPGRICSHAYLRRAVMWSENAFWLEFMSPLTIIRESLDQYPFSIPHISRRMNFPSTSAGTVIVSR